MGSVNNEDGETVEPVDKYGEPMDRTITINKVKQLNMPGNSKAKGKEKSSSKGKAKDKDKPSSIFDIGEENEQQNID